jgi:hypothetical protein
MCFQENTKKAPSLYAGVLEKHVGVSSIFMAPSYPCSIFLKALPSEEDLEEVIYMG